MASSESETEDLEFMRRELEQWRRELVRCKEEGSTESFASLQEQLEKRELALGAVQRRGQETLDCRMPDFLAHSTSSVNVAVAGCSGVGKSLLVNSIRRVKFGDAEHAPVGTKHTTSLPTPYVFPCERPAKLWDLPGAGSRSYPRESYARLLGLRHFDVVLLVTGCRFTQTDADIFKSLCERDVPTLVVRTMVDIDIASNREDHQQSASLTLQHIMEDFHEKGITNPYLVNARKPDDHDFPRLMLDAQKALIQRCNQQVQSSPKRLKAAHFRPGDAAEVVVLSGPQAGCWVRCTITGPGTQPDAFAISLPDAPPEKRNVPNVHISALRNLQEELKLEEEETVESPLLGLGAVKEVLGALKAASSKADVQTTLAAMEKQDPMTMNLSKMKRTFVTEVLGQALSGLDVPAPGELSPLLVESIRSHQANLDVQKTAHEVESLLTLGPGELFGIPKEVKSKAMVSVRDLHRLAQRVGASWWVVWLLCASAFLDLVSLAALPGMCLQPLLLLFRMYAHFQHSRAKSASRLEKLAVPFFHALGSVIACLFICTAASWNLAPASLAEPPVLARRLIEHFGSLGVGLSAFFVHALQPIYCASQLGCQTLPLMLASFGASFARSLIDLELLLALRHYFLQVMPFTRGPGGHLAEGKRAAEALLRAQRTTALGVLLGLSLLSALGMPGSTLLRHCASLLRYAMHYLHSVEGGASPLFIPAADATATSLGVLAVQVAGRVAGPQAVTHLLREGWAKGAVESYGSLAAGFCALGSQGNESLLGAAAGVSGCNALLLAPVIFSAILLRNLALLEGSLAAIKGFEVLVAEKSE